MASQLEKYLAGVPLTEELAALQQGEITAEQLPAVTRDTRPLTDDDREHLRRLEVEPGWPIVLRLLDRYIDRQESVVRQMSMEDPLGKRDEVAQGWAYVAMIRRTRNALVGLLEQEIRALENTAGGHEG